MTDVWDLVIRAAGDLAWPGSTERWRQLTGGVDLGRTARRLPGAESAVPVGRGRGALGDGRARRLPGKERKETTGRRRWCQLTGRRG